MKVCKFGGSSVASSAQIQKVCEIVHADPDRKIVVVSAPGRRVAEDEKVTDMLIKCAEARLAGVAWETLLDPVIVRYEGICAELEIEEGVIRDIAQALRDVVGGSTEHAGRYLDAVKAAGEDNCARVVAGALRKMGLDAAYVNPGAAGLEVTAEYGHARLLPGAMDKLGRLRDQPGIMVVPGFFGCTPDGEIVTFSRGGSDITGAILAAAVGAECYENFTDVDAVFCADPRVVESPLAVCEITFREMRELAYAGFNVLHDEAIVPAVRAGIPICIKNTNAPEAPGTRIVPQHLSADCSRVVGIAASSGFCTVHISKFLMNREVGFGRRLLQIFEEEGVSYEHTPSGIDNMSVIVSEESFSPEIEKAVCRRIEAELDVDTLGVVRGEALIMVVGEGMRYTVGIAEEATKAFADADVNIEMINQGSSEISMMFGVKAADVERAVRALYHVFFGEGAMFQHGIAD